MPDVFTHYTRWVVWMNGVNRKNSTACGWCNLANLSRSILYGWSIASVPHCSLFMFVNTQAPGNLQGKHWKTLFIDRNKRGEVFDSLASPRSNTLIRWLNRYTPSFAMNRKRYQHPLSSTCGAFALHFILNRLHDPMCQADLYCFMKINSMCFAHWNKNVRAIDFTQVIITLPLWVTAAWAGDHLLIRATGKISIS